MNKTSALLIGVAIATSGCGEKSQADNPKKTGRADNKSESKTLPKLGIKLDVPPGATFLNESEQGVDVSVDETGFQIMTVSGSTQADALTFTDAIAKAEGGDPCPFGAWATKEQTTNGWRLQWTCKAGATKVFTNVEVRTIIAGKHLSCGNQVSSAAEAAAIATACRSVQKL